MFRHSPGISMGREVPITVTCGAGTISQIRSPSPSKPPVVVRPDRRMSPRNSAAPDISDSERSSPFSGNHGSLALQPPAHACQHSAKLRLPALGLEPARFQNACRAATDRSSLEVPTYISRSPIADSPNRAEKWLDRVSCGCRHRLGSNRSLNYSATSPESVTENAARRHSSNSVVGSRPYHRCQASARASSSVRAATTTRAGTSGCSTVQWVRDSEALITVTPVPACAGSSPSRCVPRSVPRFAQPAPHPLTFSTCFSRCTGSARSLWRSITSSMDL